MRKLLCTIILTVFWPTLAFTHTKLTLQIQHTKHIESLAFSPNGKTVASGSADATVKLWDVKTGKLISTLEGHVGWVRQINFSPDGKILISVSDGGGAQIWDLLTRRLIKRFDEQNVVAISWDSKVIAVGYDEGTVGLWDIASKRMLKVFGRNTSKEQKVRSWDQVVSNNKPVTLDAHTSRVTAVGFSPDGKTIISGSDDQTIKFWDCETGNLIETQKWHIEPVQEVFYSPNGKIVVSTDMSRIKFWDTHAKKLIKTLIKNHEDHIEFSKDGKFLIQYNKHIYGSMLNNKKVAAKVMFWDTNTWQQRSKGFDILTGGSIVRVSYDKTGRVAAVAEGETIRLWTVDTGNLGNILRAYSSYINFTAFSPDGSTILIGSEDEFFRLWDLETGKIKSVNRGYPSRFIKGGKIIAGIGSDTKSTILWDTGSGKRIQTQKVNASVESFEPLNFSPDGTIIASSDADRRIKLYDVETGSVLRTLENSFLGEDYNSCANFSPDGKVIAVGGGFRNGHSVKLWEVDSGKLIASLESHTQPVTSVIFSHKGRLLASTSRDATIKLWDLVHKKLVNTLVGHQSTVNTARFNQKDTVLASASDDATVNLWDVSTAELIQSLSGHKASVKSVGFSPNGRFVISGGNDSQTKIWNKSTGRELLNVIILDGSADYVLATRDGRFDGTEIGINKALHFTKGLEIIELAQLKERYFEPNLWPKIFGTSDESLRNIKAMEDIQLYPEIKLSTKDNKLRIELTKRDGGIGKVSLFINSKEVLEDVNPERVLTLSIDLNKYERYFISNQKNIIAVRSYNSEGWLQSRFEEITYTPAKKPDGIRDVHYYAIVVGTADYAGNELDLRFSDKDAIDMSNAFQLSATNLFGQENVFVHLFTSQKKVLDENKYSTLSKVKWQLATKSNIKKTFEQLSKTARTGDVIVVYLSGHGTTYVENNKDYFYYLTKDIISGDLSDPGVRKNHAISTSEIRTWLTDITALKQVLIVDTCYSGNLAEELCTMKNVPSSHVRALDRLKDRTGLFILAGSAANKPSYETTHFGQSLLTYSLLLGIQSEALRDKQFIDVVKLFQFSADEVPLLAKFVRGVQKPIILSSRGNSYDIGKITDYERQHIVLKETKPIFLRSNFQNELTYNDELKLSLHLDQILNEMTLKGRKSKLIFIDVPVHPQGYAIRGRYVLTNSEVLIKARVFKGDKADSIFELTGKTSELNAMLAKVVEKALSLTNFK